MLRQFQFFVLMLLCPSDRRYLHNLLAGQLLLVVCIGRCIFSFLLANSQIWCKDTIVLQIICTFYPKSSSDHEQTPIT